MQKKIVGPNVSRSEKFNHKLRELMDNVYELLELTKEYEFERITEDGETVYLENDSKTCFQVSRQYERPTEFLQTILDIIRVNYEPSVLGTFFLNSNLCFMYDEIPNKPFHLGYVSIVSGYNEDFASFYSGSVMLYLTKCGYNLEQASAIYAVASTGEERYGFDFLDEVITTLESGFSLNEVLSLFASSFDPQINNPQKKCYAGYCLDPALENKIRLSMWIFQGEGGQSLH